MSLFCINCGKNLSQIGQAAFCPGCGAKIEQSQQLPNEAAASGPAAYTPPPQAAYTPPQAAYTPPQQAACTPPQTAYTPPQAAYTPSQAAYPPPQTAYSPQSYARAPKSGMSTGAVAGIVLGGIAVLALIVFAVLYLGKTQPYEGSPEKLSGSWDAVLSVNTVKGASDIVDQFDTIIGKKLDQTLVLSLDKFGKGTAELYSNSEEVGDLNGLAAHFKDGKLTLTGLDGDFNFVGTIGSKSKTLKGKFTIEDAGASASGTITAQWVSKDGAEQSAAALTQAPELTEVPAQKQPMPTPQQAPPPTATQVPADEPDAFTLNDYMVGEWISEELGDGTSLVYVFYNNGQCMTVTTIVQNNGTMDGWKTGDWYTEFQAYGVYEIVNQTLSITLDMDGEGTPRFYEINVIDEGTVDFKEEYGDGSFTMTMTRIG